MHTSALILIARYVYAQMLTSLMQSLTKKIVLNVHNRALPELVAPHLQSIF